MNSPALSPTGAIVVIGGGMWGSALTELLRRNGLVVTQWSRRHPEPLSALVTQAPMVVSAVSMAGVAPTIARLSPDSLPAHTIIVSATKGLDRDTWQTPTQLWQAALPAQAIVVLSGPNLSKEIGQGLPAATVAASHIETAAKSVQHTFASEQFRVYVNRDPLGTELGGTLKNVVAIAAGVCDGLALGTNAKAALLTRALPEMVRVGCALGAQRETFFGLAGLGDLLATCSSPLSRNYQVGYRLAQGEPLAEILATLEGTAEGVNTTQVLVKLAQERQLAVPIAIAVNQLLATELTPQEAVQRLMMRELTTEF